MFGFSKAEREAKTRKLQMIVDAVNGEEGVTARLKNAGTRDEEAVITVTVSEYPGRTCRGFAAYLGAAIHFEVYLATTYAEVADDARKKLTELYSTNLYSKLARPFGLTGNYRTIALVEDSTLSASVRTDDVAKTGAAIELLREMIRNTFSILPN